MIKRLNIFFCAIMLSSFISLFGQDKPKSGIKHIKLYLNGFYRFSDKPSFDGSSSVSPQISIKKEKYDFGDCSIAIEIDRGKFFSQELELMPIKISHDNEKYIISYPTGSYIYDGGRPTAIESRIRYQINHYFFREKFINPQISLSSQLYYDYSKYSPITSRTFPVTCQNTGILLTCNPGIILNINKKLSLDFNVPFGIYSLRLNSTKFEHPALKPSDRKNSDFIGDFIPDYLNFRIGIRYEI